MLKTPRDLLGAFPVRKTKIQKQEFRNTVQTYMTEQGYGCTVERGRLGCCNLIFGNPESAKYLVTAHYDTSARLPIPNIITPCNFWLFLLCQILLSILLVVPGLLLGWFLGEITGHVGPGLLLGYLLVFVNIVLMIFGPENPRNANDNTSGVITLLEIARTLPDNQRHKVCFVLFDLEEAGLIGSNCYRKRHSSVIFDQIVLNLDCVGDGDHLRIFPTGKLKKDRKKLSAFYKVCGYFGKKELLLHEKGFSIYPSDQMSFPYGVGICALRKKKKTLYMSRIHTSKDTILDETNINILRAALTTYICCEQPK